MLEIKRKIYDDKDWYEEYIQVLKDGKEIHYGESFDLPKYENGNYIFYLNYGNIEYYQFFLIIFKTIAKFSKLTITCPFTQNILYCQFLNFINFFLVL